MGARGPTGAAHSPARTTERVIERVSDEREGGEARRASEVGEEKEGEREPLINILIRSESHVPGVLYL